MKFRHLDVTAIATDSREVTPGSLFVALKGARVDGHKFLEQARQGGARAALVSEEVGVSGMELIQVEDPLRALQEEARRQLGATRVLAITGSVGKTSTKEFAATLMNAYCSPGNRNSQVGLPLAVLEAGEQPVMVLEMGMTEPGQIGRLIEVAPPEVALITSVSPVHAEGFASLEEIAAAKGEIFGNGGIRVAPHGWSDCITHSVTERSANYFGELRDQLHLFEFGEEHVLPWTLPGKHNVANIVAAVAGVRQMGCSWEEIEQRWEELRLPAGRFEVIERGGVTVISDCYNMGRDAACSALESLPKVSGERIGFMSEMTELGDFSAECHRAVGECARLHLDRLYVIGEGAGPMVDWEGAHLLGSKEQLREAAFAEAKRGNLLLFKGARLYALEEIVTPLLAHLS
jgi:UDP-N-acetylmuramoyl-tripeptide--D-alanyl-D-alanine ligase